MRPRLIVCAAAVLLSLAQAGAAPHGVYDVPAPLSLKGVRFTFQAQGPIRSTPALAGGMLYFGSADHNFYAIDAATGQERWRIATGGAVNSSPAVVDGTVFFASRDGKLYAADAAQGRVRWRFGFGADLGPQNYWDFYLSSPVSSGANLYAGSGDGHVYALNRRTGRAVWSYDAGARVRTTPAVTGGLVVFGTMSGHVIALDAASGARRWDFATKGATNKFEDKENDTTSIVASPVIADGVVAVGGRDGFIYGIDLATGKQLWTTTHDGSSWILSVAAEGGTLYVGSGSAAIVQAADLKTGTERWRFATAGANFGAVTLAGGVLLDNDFAGNLYAVDRTSGKELWRFAMGDRTFAAPVAGADTVYASSDAGVLYALATAPVATAPSTVRKLVYWEGKTSKEAFSWFQNDIDVAILNYFKGAGYEPVDAARLRQAMLDQIAGTRSSVVVFADDRAPANVMETMDDKALLRGYLEGGGRLAFLGTNPAAIKLDPKTGEAIGFEYDDAAKMFGVVYPALNIDRGYHVSQATADGVAWGLRGFFVGSEAIDPKEASVVLARDEFGMASAWVKYYGGAKHGALLQLAVPRNALGSLTQYRLAVEHGLE